MFLKLQLFAMKRMPHLLAASFSLFFSNDVDNLFVSFDCFAYFQFTFRSSWVAQISPLKFRPSILLTANNRIKLPV